MSASAAAHRDVPLAIYLDPPSHHFLRDRLFDAAMCLFSGDESLAPFVAVRDHFAAHGIPVHTADALAGGPGRRKLYVSLGEWQGFARRLRRHGAVPSAIFALECPVVEPRLYRALPRLSSRFRRVFTWSEPVHLEPYSRRPFASLPFRLPQPTDGVHEAIWRRRDRRFLTLVNTNKLPRHPLGELYGERRRAIAFFSRHGEIDVFGRYWDEAPRRVGRTWVPATLRRLGLRLWRVRQRLFPNPVYADCAAAWRGATSSKRDTLGGYHFALCYENAAVPGYLTEKVFDCFACGTVPIYLGAPDVGSWIPAECFIDRRELGDDSDLRRFLHALPVRRVEALRDAARDFLASERFAPFRPAAFVAHFRRIVAEDAGVAT